MKKDEILIVAGVAIALVFLAYQAKEAVVNSDFGKQASGALDELNNFDPISAGQVAGAAMTQSILDLIGL